MNIRPMTLRWLSLLALAVGFTSCSSPYFAEAPLRHPLGDSHRADYYGELGNLFLPTEYVPPGAQRD